MSTGVPGEASDPRLARELEEARAELADAKRALAYERDRNEAALLRAERTLKICQRLAQVGSWVWHIADNRLEWSDEMFRIFGVESAGFSGDLAAVVAEAIHPDDREPVERANRAVIEEGRPRPLEYRIRRPDGSIRVVWGEAAELALDAAGRPAILRGIVLDVTDRRRAEAVLRESQAKLRAALEATTDAVFVSDAAGEFVDFNEAFASFHRFRDKAECLRYLSDYPRILDVYSAPGVLAPLEAWAVPRALRGETVTNEEYTLVRKDTRETWVGSYSFAPIRDAAGAVVGSVVVARDVTDRKRAEGERAKLEAQLRQAQKMESVGRLAGGVAHDFNNMLGVILAHTELALEQVDSRLPLHDDLLEIRKAGNRSADLTRQLLAFARKQSVAPRVLDLNATLAGMLKLLQRLIGENVSIDWFPGVGLWRVEIDPSQIDQILANLCVNSRDAIGGVGRLTIETSNCALAEVHATAHGEIAPGEYVRLEVRDDGRGMDAHTLEHVFEPFFTTKPIGEGTGLGLVTVYGIVRQNGGFVEARSEPGRGAVFAIYLPRRRVAGDGADAEDSLEAAPRGRETILVVEDESPILNATSRILQALGYRVLKAQTPTEAVQLARAHARDIDLVLTDVVMPEMNGRELADRLLAIRPTMRRLYMSGYTADVIAHQGNLDEGVLLIQKPFSRHDLAAKVRLALDGPRAG